MKGRAPPTKRSTAAQPCQVAPCAEPAGFGLGPPLAAFQLWFCSYHWGRLPETQAMYADRLLLAAGVDNDDQQRGK